MRDSAYPESRVLDPSPPAFAPLRRGMQSSPLLQGRGGTLPVNETGCGFMGMGAGFIKVPEMDLIAFC